MESAASSSGIVEPSLDLVGLTARLGRAHLGARLRRQVDYASRFFGPGLRRYQLENMPLLREVVEKSFRLSGQYERAYEEYLDVQVRTNEVELEHLPEAFRGFRILHLSDLHLDLDAALLPRIQRAVAKSHYDLCVMTGDYRNATDGPYGLVVERMKTLLKEIHGPVYGVLGNHDFIEMVAPLEAAGLRLLINEAVALERGGKRLWLVGVDDPSTYMVDNLPRALDGVTPGSRTILLSHAPGIYERAQAYGVDFVLAGHTHGGQICLPGGVALLYNDRCPRALVRGAWKWKNLLGYTSPGTGACAAPLRYYCPPEITVHRLDTKTD